MDKKLPGTEFNVSVQKQIIEKEGLELRDGIIQPKKGETMATTILDMLEPLIGNRVFFMLNANDERHNFVEMLILHGYRFSEVLTDTGWFVHIDAG